ncbi:diphosphoinositol polyphosphate phosphohydrolase 1-like [Tigriopus californicus]|uniref:diphosphoinositol polyphosphate phosphohydrolase 1-like n=1 Tax=Tigriopus californicus TaxID=6832 RepID=UPI0027DA920C|nr:diphosphoinositol polyphosphate phosphohydrolase 1-like [Tigriopus californicus]XP_059085210.1 diphosphoinositol polyphosphate phosphohydrolase 1-like [Tigriopus californicus]XP_059085211.1 diphosphoinositol polyphosphate phosphohydrolase 1-like [Tigriopus californicus]XP_059085213.1 diphosphoinositol polyphosphate phosphohydrolase 1-like [Tigriopus californicus]XP_059085214.1 diphosphoinositol polyphosphate phosphohydrolase 1-like [Tigriopus californicus]XP_059085215.1 diphosphoinositol po|eukprot:TCALIF_06609-PA protein Name:"Similar to NUDT3 Diphosphoinositol polyphosphate phosphohydrolase 1 (Homo sapiens)" AED:0.30 eAED:0.30 QI:0/-1/0/1/-1/1/1/0/166
MTKQKKYSQDDRIFDKDGFTLRAACVCVRDDSESEILLVSSSANPDRWIIPGGKIETQETPEYSGMREAMEEAGAVGELGRCLGVFENRERHNRTHVYVLKVNELLDDFDDAKRRKRRWFPIEEAVQVLSPFKPLHSKYLNTLQATKNVKVGPNSPVILAAESPLK